MFHSGSQVFNEKWLSFCSFICPSIQHPLLVPLRLSLLQIWLHKGAVRMHWARNMLLGRKRDDDCDFDKATSIKKLNTNCFCVLSA